MTHPGFAYAQARMQARHGNRPTSATWQRLAASQGVDQLFESARGTSLERWVRSMPRDAGAHAVEAELIAAYRGQVDEVASWVPERWAAAVRWMRWLPLLQRLEAGAPIATEDEDGPGLGGPGTARAWLGQLLELSPRAEQLAPVLEAVRTHRQAMQRARDHESGWSLREALAVELERVLRRRAASPSSVFAYLGLELLEIESLRAAIVVRVAMGPAWREWAWV